MNMQHSSNVAEVASAIRDDVFRADTVERLFRSCERELSRHGWESGSDDENGSVRGSAKMRQPIQTRHLRPHLSLSR
jgi:hypothetical protein